MRQERSLDPLGARRPRRTAAGLLLLATLAVAWATGAGAPTFDASFHRPRRSGEGRFIWLSDLHIDPFYGTPAAYGNCTSPSSPRWGAFGCDSPWRLVQATISHAKEMEPDPDFVLVTGDFSRHGNDAVEDPFGVLRSLMHNVSQLLVETFPNAHTLHSPSAEAHADVAISLGNNDVIPDYYLDTTKPHSKLLALVAEAFNGTLLPAEVATVKHGGYLVRNVTHNLRLISLNTIVYSSYHVPASLQQQDPLGQFAWLEQQLAFSLENKMPVYIVGHIPPTLGSYDKRQNWHTQYIRTYNKLVSKYHKVVKAQLFGHLHSDEFRIPREETPIVPLLIAPSVTPVYRNNPSFRVVTYKRKTGTILNHNAYYLPVSEGSPNPRWRPLYSFRNTYGVVDLSSNSLNALVTRMEKRSELLATFRSVLRQHVVQPPCDDECHVEWLCLFRSATKETYDACVGSGSKSGGSASPLNPLLIGGVVAGGVALVAGVALVIALALRRRRERSSAHAYIMLTTSEDEFEEDNKMISS